MVATVARTDNALVTAAETWMGEQGIASKPRMVAMLAPGFPE